RPRHRREQPGLAGGGRTRRLLCGRGFERTRGARDGGRRRHHHLRRSRGRGPRARARTRRRPLRGRAHGRGHHERGRRGRVTALARDRGGRVFAATSNPGALWRLGPERTEHGELTSSSLDARRFARFGHVRWRGQANGGRIQLETRSGNTDPADTTWSSWRPITDQGVRSPAARYLQWKITMAGGNPRVDAVEVGWREQNIPPRVEDVAVAP